MADEGAGAANVPQGSAPLSRVYNASQVWNIKRHAVMFTDVKNNNGSVPVLIDIIITATIIYCTESNISDQCTLHKQYFQSYPVLGINALL